MPAMKKKPRAHLTKTAAIPAGMRELHFLALDGTVVNGSGLGSLIKMPNMSQLQLMNSQLTAENWLKFVPKMESYSQGLMFLSRGSKITPDEAQEIRKLAKGQSFLN